MPRFLSAKPNSRLIPLPWHIPLEQWPTENLVALPRGISRHVVRFIKVGDDVYAAKEVIEHLAIHEYRLLHDLSRLGKPAVEPIGVVTGRVDADGNQLDPILLTKHLEFALPYRSLFLPGTRRETVMRLLDAMVVLIAKLHLSGFMWGDISLSNVLFRRDAGEFAAYLLTPRPANCTKNSARASGCTISKSAASTSSATPTTWPPAASSTARGIRSSWWT